MDGRVAEIELPEFIERSQGLVEFIGGAISVKSVWMENLFEGRIITIGGIVDRSYGRMFVPGPIEIPRFETAEYKLKFVMDTFSSAYDSYWKAIYIEGSYKCELDYEFNEKEKNNA